MKILFHFTAFLWLYVTGITTALAVEPLPSHLINFTSHSGAVLLKKDLNENTLKLLAHFTTQKTLTYCGIASAVMVLNAVGIAPPVDSQHAPYRYFNQDNFFNDSVKHIVTPEAVQKNGIDLTTLSQVIERYGLTVKLFHANKLNVKTFRATLQQAISHKQFIIVNFLRTQLHQQGGGHHSPIAAYDKQTDRFLILDVARFKYPAYWVKTKALWDAVNTLDSDAYRGFIIMNSPYVAL